MNVDAVVTIPRAELTRLQRQLSEQAETIARLRLWCERAINFYPHLEDDFGAIEGGSDGE